MKSLSADLHYVHKLYAQYHDPSSNGTPDISFSQGCFTTQNAKVGKGQFSQIFIAFCQTLIRSSTPWTQSVSQIS